MMVPDPAPTMGRSVYQMGYAAACARASIDANPYTEPSHWWEEWRRGYHDATR